MRPFQRRIVPRHELRPAIKPKRARAATGVPNVEKWVSLVRPVAERLIEQSAKTGKPFRTKNEFARAIAAAPDLSTAICTSSIETALTVLERAGLRIPRGEQTRSAYTPKERREILDFYHAFAGTREKAVEATRARFGVGEKTLRKWLRKERAKKED